MNIPYLGWDGKLFSQICSSMTGTTEKHWMEDGKDACEEMINRSVSSKMTLARSFLQLYIVFIVTNDIFYVIRSKIRRLFIKQSDCNEIYFI